MNMRKIRVESINPEVEEEVTINSGVARLMCFSSGIPKFVRIGYEYPVELTLQVFGDYKIEEIEPDAAEEVIKLPSGYSYLIKGLLKDGCLQACGFSFQEEALKSEFSYLSGNKISIVVDRVGVKFIDR